MKKFIFGICLLILTSCGVYIPATGPEVISIQVLDEQRNPISSINVKVVYENEKLVFTNCLNGTFTLPLTYQGKTLYIGAEGKDGIILPYAEDTVVYLKSKQEIGWLQLHNNSN